MISCTEASLSLFTVASLQGQSSSLWRWGNGRQQKAALPGGANLGEENVEPTDKAIGHDVESPVGQALPLKT